MENGKRKLVIRILGTAAVLVAAIAACTFLAKRATEPVEARMVLKQVSDKYIHSGSTTQFKILEVVPEHSDHEYEEIGYFMKDQSSSPDFIDVSKAKSIGSFSGPEGIGNLLRMRDYGLIKALGQDVTSDNPVYSDEATFYEDDRSGYAFIDRDKIFVYGEYAEGLNGDYQLEPGYEIDPSSHQIRYTGTVSDPNPNPEDSLSSNHYAGGANYVGGAALTRTLSVIANTDSAATEAPQEDVPAVNDQDEVTITVEDEEKAEPDKEEDNKEAAPGKETPQSQEDSEDMPKQPEGAMLQDVEAGADGSSTDGAYGSGYYQRTGITVDEMKIIEGSRSILSQKLPEGIRYVGDGTGNATFTENPAGQYFGHPAKGIYYTTKSGNNFHNAEWFKELVFGDKDVSVNISIDVKTPDEVGDIVRDGKQVYDLIYISGRNEAYIGAGRDFEDTKAVEIYNAVTGSSHQAVIMDYALIDRSTVGGKTAEELKAFEKLALLLWQENQTAIIAESISENGAGGFGEHNGFSVTGDESAGYQMVSYSGVDNAVWQHLLGQIMGAASNGNFVAGSVYVYEHALAYFDNSKALVDASDVFGNGDFDSSYVDYIENNGFGEVAYAIKVNNANNPDRVMSEAVTPAVVVQYILTYEGNASKLVKNELRILEIQPCRDFKYNIGWGSESYEEIASGRNSNKGNVLAARKKFIVDYLGEPFYHDETGEADMENIDKVRFTSMTIEEFICNSDNLNEEYDIIYIGSNYSKNQSYETYSNGSTGNYHQVTNQAWSGSGPDDNTDGESNQIIPDFRDDQMDGMVYFNIGDIINVSSYGWEKGKAGLSGFLLTEEYTNLWDTNRTYPFRYTARDLTTYKKWELLDYLKVGYPIIVDGDLFKSEVIGEDEETHKPITNKIINPTAHPTSRLVGNGYDHGRIDDSSVMYEFFQVATGQSVDDETETKNGYYSSAGYDNLISTADVKNGIVDKNDVIAAVNAAKFSMNVTSRPVEYEYTQKSGGEIDTMTFLQSEVDGKYYLDFEFTLQDIGIDYESGGADDYYVPHLYVDVNADGKFAGTEELEGAVVTNALTGVEVPFVNTSRGYTYKLAANTLYHLRRDVPEGYQGVLPWCLKVESYLHEKVSASETGYTAIKGQEAATIRIFQLMSYGDAGYETLANNKNTLDLSNENLDNGNPDNDYWRIRGTAYETYLDNLEDLGLYKLEVVSRPISWVVNNGSSGEWYAEKGRWKYWEEWYAEHLWDYDMLVLGFADNYNQVKFGPFLDALEEYIRSGRPVLLCHDFMGHDAGFGNVRQLRDILGLDRYGVTDDSLKEVRTGTGYTRQMDAEKVNKIEASGRRVAYQPNSGKRTLLGQTQGLTNYITTKYQADSESKGYRYLNSPDVSNYWNRTPGNQDQVDNYNQAYIAFVNKVNDGQITNYPYKLPDAFAVNKTHGQYFQPNMERDVEDDGISDMTIWYTLGYGHSLKDNPGADTTTSKLSDGVYNIAPKDGVNNYYIFNNGNVTYTGSGHSMLTSPYNKYEAQLFINTLVAAYRAGIKAPTVTIYDGSDLNSTVTTSIAVPYDENIGLNADDSNKSESSILKGADNRYQYPFVDIEDENAARVFFRVSDPNMVRGRKEVKLRFLREVPSNQEIFGPEGSQYIVIDTNHFPVETITVDTGEEVKVFQYNMPYYSKDFNERYASSTVASAGVMYGLKLPMELLKEVGDFKLYVEAQTVIYSTGLDGSENEQSTAKVYTSLGVTKMDLLKLD